MFILKPLKSILFTKDDIGTVEEVVRETKLVDKGIEELKRFSPNAPSFEPGRRKFLKHAAVLAGLYATGQLLKGCATVQEPVHFGGKTYGGWEAYLLTQDLIRGPKLLIHPSTGLPSDFEHHIKQGWSGGFGAVDFDVPIGTPVVPTADAYRLRTDTEREGGTSLYLYHWPGPYRIGYNHLDDYTEITSKGRQRTIGRFQVRDQFIDKLKVIAFSGNTGIGPGGGIQRPHLHFSIARWNPSVQLFESPGINPFQAGIDAEKPFGGVDEYGIPYGGKPVYWEGRAEIPLNLNQRKRLLRKSLDTLDKRVRESDLDKGTKDELLKRHNNPEAERDYLGMLVLRKHQGKDGKHNYRYPPATLPYALMLEVFSRTSNQEFIAMLPFISPFVKELYQQTNPEVRF